ncbi:MAG: hypothetical protein LAO56_20995 [Acidobacteriia bacterium]|nr:hypothetical protein [Terriglobia bacterium]
MHKFKRSRPLPIVCFHVRNQLISGTGVDPQFQIGNIVGDFVRSNDFDGITAGIAGLLYLLRFERVDNLGAYRIPSESSPLIPSVYINNPYFLSARVSSWRDGLF